MQLIRNGTIAEAVWISNQIPEFLEPYSASEYEKRLPGCRNLILIAEVDNALAGFKVGYERDGFFYSWMGGVIPEFRRLGLAQQLADEQEAWAIAEGFRTLRFKTLNRHRKMLHFALQNGFWIIAVDPRKDPWEHRIWLEKKLSLEKS